MVVGNDEIGIEASEGGAKGFQSVADDFAKVEECG